MDNRLLNLINRDLKEQFEAGELTYAGPLPTTRPDLKKNTLLQITKPRTIDFFYNRLDISRRCYTAITIDSDATIDDILIAINKTPTPLYVTDVNVVVSGTAYLITAKPENLIWLGSASVTVNH